MTAKQSPAATNRIGLLLGGGIALAIALAVGYQVVGSDEAQSASPAGSAKSGTEPSVALPEQAKVRTDRYTLSYAFSSQLQGAPFVEMALDGPLELVEVERSATQRLVRGQLTAKLKVSQGGQSPAPAELAKLTSQLSQPFVVEYASNGQVEALRLAPGLDRVVQTTLRAVVTAMQFVRAPEAAQSWEVEERDASGRYLAAYTRSGLTSGRTGFVKRKLRYLEGYGGVTTTIDAYQGSFELEAGGLQDAALRSVEIQERSRAAAPSGVGAGLGAVEAEVRLQLSWQQSFDGKRPSALVRYERLALLDAGSDAAKQRELDHAIVAGHKYASLVETLGKAATTKEEKQQRTKAYRALASMVRLDAQHVADLEQRIRERDPQLSTWIAALRDAGTPEAQQALVRLVDEPALDDGQRMELARAMSLVALPTQETTATLRRLVNDPALAEQAVYGLGTHANRLAEHGQDSEALLNELLTGLDQAETPLEQNRYLTALGNSGQRGALNALDQSLRTGGGSVKAEAVHALRNIPGEDVDQRLVIQLSAADVRSRQQAAKAIRDREHTAVLEQGLADALRRETNPLVQTALVQTSALWARGSDTIRQSLAWLTTNATHPNVKKQATSALRAAVGGDE